MPVHCEMLVTAQYQIPAHPSISTEGECVCLCVCMFLSDEAPDDGEHGHEAIKDSNAITHVETMARYISRRKHRQIPVFNMLASSPAVR